MTDRPDKSSRFDSQFYRINCQIFSWPLSSGARGGSCKSEILLGTLRALAPCQRLDQVRRLA
jgi:hypothetical protein